MQMSWIGKVGGGLLGFAAGGPLGAVIGAILGHQYDRSVLTSPPGTKSRRIDEDVAATPGERQRVFFEVTFLAMGHLAKVDGRVSEAEIQAARAAMRRLRLGEAEIERAIQLFNTGKQLDFALDSQLARLRRYCGRQPELIREFLELQLDMVTGAGPVTVPERMLLARMADRLGVSRVELLHLEAMIRARRSFGQQRAQQAESLDKAYESLGLQPTATDDEVKTAYRRLVNQHHPDKQAARGLPDSMRQMAEERTREILAAYDLIRERRSQR